MRNIVYLIVVFVFLSVSNFYLYGAGKTIQEIQAEQQAEQQKKELKRNGGKKKAPSKKQKGSIKVVKSVPPFDETLKDNIDLLEVDPFVVAKYNEAVEIEKAHEENKIAPQKAIKAWSKLLKIKNENPFISIGKKRLRLWLGYVKYLNYVKKKKKSALNNIKKMIPMNSIAFDMKIKAVMQYMKKYSIDEGMTPLLQVLDRVDANKKIVSSEEVKSFSENIIKTRCERGVSEECYRYSTLYGAGSQNNIEYLAKACGLKHSEACEELKIIAEKEQMVLRQAEEVKRKELEVERQKQLVEKEKKDRIKKQKLKIKRKKELAEKRERERLQKIRQKEDAKKRKLRKELSLAGGKKRRIRAGVILGSGVVSSILGGILLSRIPQSQKNQDLNYEYYMNTTDQEEIDIYRNRILTHHKQENLFKVFGGIFMGVGIVCVTTGIVLFSIDSEGEKKVKKKYNMSMQVNPFGQSVSLTIKY